MREKKGLKWAISMSQTKKFAKGSLMRGKGGKKMRRRKKALDEPWPREPRRRLFYENKWTL